MARLKIATFNINGVRARHGALMEWLEREKPDIACLQELKAPEEAFPQLDIEALGYGAIWHGQKSWNGVAILARGAQPGEVQRGLPDDPDGTQSRYLEADVHGLRVACLYLPNGNPQPGPKFAYKLAWFAELRRRTAALLRSGRPTVVCGDFNVVPTDELDIYNAKSWRTDALLQPESREEWFALLKQGWTDAIRAVHGDEKIYTFWDYFRKHWERDAGLRIDHLLLSPNLAPMLKDAGVDRWVRGRPGASDHAPTWVVLDAAGGASKRAVGKRATKTVAKVPTAKRAAAKKSTATTKPGSRTTSKPRVATTRAAEKSAATASRSASKAATKKAAKKRVTKAATKRAAKTVTKKAVAKRGTKTSAAKKVAARRSMP
ncbi:exodeoxyribonuclease III [Lysobacter terrigena]|uniref:exodeoxyribonuclease III n=1 Tax=Cognatilysobacter terrigena TaxID=2488749 RepID=UPI00106077A3